MSEWVVVIATSPWRGVTFEIPKSRTLTTDEPSARRARKMFAGFRSRCTMPAT